DTLKSEKNADFKDLY
nr:RecName: Full=Interstitial collagenase; AltName: Full=Fibroblast collagenase; AltName: Full=Matrix metalloproteinase-1; Short=MMP-1; AltName: Full=Myocardial collagenase [Rattus norvegicus]AAB36300.1 interstitial collagenase, matrix metalloproteinase-1, MMP-1 {internal fragment, putative zinc-binding site} [rats, myocardium, Peptide Partial, 15 aa] [Rattus sp.]